jgi:AcrR family transcriptional regulator
MSTVIESDRSARPGPRATRSAAQTRERILDVAEGLFYSQGIRATGVDRVATDAGVAPTTLYRLFTSKDDLVAAYVDRYAAGYRDWIETVTSGAGVSPRERILAFFDGLVDASGSDGFRGCPFLMTLAEYPDTESSAHISAQAIKAWVRAKLRELTGELPGIPARRRGIVADQLALVVEGIYASTAALGVTGPTRHAASLAALVIDAAVDAG